MSQHNVTARINGTVTKVNEIADTRFVPGDGIYPDETLYLAVTDKGSYLVGAEAFNVDPSTLPVSGTPLVWR